MARKQPSRPTPFFPDLDPVAELLRSVPQNTDERLAHIRALGARVAKYVRGLRSVGPVSGASAEAKEKAVAVYAARRDRFDDPVHPRLKGTWEKLIVAPVHGRDSLRTWIPADPMTPTVLAGLDGSGRVFEWA